MRLRYWPVVLALTVTLAAACGTSSTVRNVEPPSPGQPAGTPLILAWDGVDHRMVMSRLASFNLRSVDSRTWYLAQGRWDLAPASQALPSIGQDRGFLVYDSDRNLELLFAFPAAPSPQGPDAMVGVYQWDGHAWTHQRPVHLPSPVDQWTSVNYIPKLHATVLLDQTVLSTGQPAMWLYDGTDWHAVNTRHGPQNVSLAYGRYDPQRQALLALTGDYLTWQFDGTDWSAVPWTGADAPTVVTGMGIRQGPAVAFDEVRGRWVLFGGNDAQKEMYDSWVGDGSSWRLLSLPLSPAPRSSVPGVSFMAWDPAIQKLVLFGGKAGFGGPDLGDTWTWDGASWMQIAGPTYPAPPTPEATPASSVRESPPASPSAATCPPAGGSPASGAMAVMVKPSNGIGPGPYTYDVTLMATNGCPVAAVHPAPRSAIAATAGPAGAPMLPEVSTANGRVYYLDGDSQVRYLAPDGSTGAVTHVPGSASAMAAFAVSPDGSRIAVSVITYNGSSASMDLYVEDVTGANHHDLFRSTSVFEWPVAWHSGDIVLAVGPAFTTQGLNVNPYAAQSYHVVDASTAVRKATLGVSTCEVTGVLSPAGAPCLAPAPPGNGGQYYLFDWNGANKGPIIGTGDGGTTASISPIDILTVALLDPDIPALEVLSPGGKQSAQLSGQVDSWPCWLNAEDVAIGSFESQAVIVDVTGPTVVSTSVLGFCAGVLGAPAQVL